MDINAVFPSKYVSASEIGDAQPTVIISHVAMEQMQDGKTLPVLYFQGKNKGLTLNKGNSQTIAGLYGPETDNWPGQQLTLFVIWTEFQGKPVQGVRVRSPNATYPAAMPAGGTPPPVPQPGASPQFVDPNPPVHTAPPANADLDDEIPF